MSQQPAAEEKIPKVDVEPKVVVVEEVESSPALEKEEPPPATPVPPLTLVQVKLLGYEIMSLLVKGLNIVFFRRTMRLKGKQKVNNR